MDLLNGNESEALWEEMIAWCEWLANGQPPGPLTVPWWSVIL